MFLLEAPYDKDTIWGQASGPFQKQLIDKKRNFCNRCYWYRTGDWPGARINTIMQTAFFKISKVIDDKVPSPLKSHQKDLRQKGEAIVNMNIASIDKALEGIQQVTLLQLHKSGRRIESRFDGRPDFVKEVTAKIIKQEGDELPVSKIPCMVYGLQALPSTKTQYRSGNTGMERKTCIQCHRCSLVCPHAAIRPKAYDAKYLENAPATFKSTDAKGKELAGLKYTLQVAPEDWHRMWSMCTELPHQRQRQCHSDAASDSSAGIGSQKLGLVPLHS